MSNSERRTCPDCGSTRVDLTQRGLTGPTDESNQHFQCRECGRVTFEIVSRSAREIRLENIESGKVIRESGHNYRVKRVLKIGLDEFLVYLRADNDAQLESGPNRPRS